jgi:hypothetical protein
MGELLENLEIHIGVLLQHFSDLERYVIHPPPSALYILKIPSGNLSPVVVEAASSVIFAAPHVDSKGTAPSMHRWADSDTRVFRLANLPRIARSLPGITLPGCRQYEQGSMRVLTGQYNYDPVCLRFC